MMTWTTLRAQADLALRPVLRIVAVLATALLIGPAVTPTLMAAQDVASAAASGERSASVALPDGVATVASVEGITEYRLDNGLRVLLFPDQSNQQVTVNVTYLVGSRHEGYGETGMAHLLEHLLFKGTPDHPDIPQELTEHGASPNGTTWFDRTNYFETFPASPENVAWALELEADRMVNSSVAEENLDSEMTVVRNEWELGENRPIGVLLKRALGTAFHWHNYGKSTIGARADIENVPIDRLRAFYRKYYQPDNALLVVAGRFDPERTLALVAEEFGAIPRPDRTGDMKLYPTYTAEPPQDGERTVELHRVGDVQVVGVVYHVPPGSHEEFAAVDVLTHILDTEPAGRLYRNLVEPGLAASAEAGNFQLAEPGVLYAYARVRKDDPLEDARRALLSTMQELVVEPPSETEVERAKRAYLKEIEQAFSDPQGMAVRLSNWAAMGDWRLFFLHRGRLERVTPGDVHRVARTYLRPSNRTVATFLPADTTPPRAEVPPPPDVDALVAGYEGREAVAAGEAFEPTPSNIEARTQRFIFDNGFRLALTPKENRGDVVTVRLGLRLGSEEALRGQAVRGDLAVEMLERGTRERSRQEIEDELDRLKADVQLYGDAAGVHGLVETRREHLAEVLELIAEMLREPAFDPHEFELLKEERLAALEASLSEPQPRVSRAMSRHMDPWPQDHPEYTPSLEEEIARVRATTLEEVRTFWERFYGAQAGAMAVVGDHDPEEVRRLTRKLFGAWESREPYTRIERPYRDVAPVQMDIETPDKRNGWMFAALNLPIRDDDPVYPALVLANYMIGGGFLNSRLATRIRQEEGLSYAVGSQLGSHAVDKRGRFVAYALFAPENADAVVAAFRKVLKTVVEEGFTTEEFEAARRGYLDSRQNRRAEDEAVALDLYYGLFFDRTMRFTANREAAIRALTVDDVNRAVRQHIDPNRISIFRAADFAGTEGSP